jgi:hypothetical protein
VDIRVEQRFDAPLAEVEAALINPAFVATLRELPKIGHAELVSQEQEGHRVDQEVRYVFAGELSSAVRAVVDPRKLSWILESEYDLVAHTSTWRIVPDHYRDRLSSSGTTRLLADGERTRRVTAGVVKVHMALVGGRVERAIASGLVEHAEAEEVQLNRFLARSGG